MTRLAGPLALDVLLLGVGELALVGLGFVRSARQALRFAGLAFVLGWCALGSALVYALVLGAPLAAWLPAAIAGALAAAAVPLARAVRPAAERFGRRERGLLRVAAAGAAACVVAYLALAGLHAALVASPTAWDAWAFWLPRAKAIYFFHGLRPHLQGGFASFAHPEYPPLVPAFDAAVFSFASGAAVLALPFQDWLLAAAFVSAAAVVLRRSARPAVVWPALCLLVLTPQFAGSIGNGYADPQLARLVALAAVCGGVWLLERDARLLAVAGIVLVAAVLTKREGPALAVALAVALAAAARLDGRRGWWQPLALVPTAVAAALPWQVWLHVERVRYTPDYSLAALAHPGFLAHRLGRLTVALEQLPRIAVSFDHWVLVVPLALLLALLALRTRPSLGVLVLGVVLLGYVGLACVYWIGTPPLATYMRTSASRVVASLVVTAAALTPLVAAELLRADGAAAASSRSAPGKNRTCARGLGTHLR